MNTTTSITGSSGGGMSQSKLAFVIVAVIVGFCVCFVVPFVWRTAKKAVQKKRTILDVTY
jgi:uncharacterized membrane protein YedE/YeeE